MQILAIKYLFDKQLDCGPVFFLFSFSLNASSLVLNNFYELTSKKRDCVSELSAQKKNLISGDYTFEKARKSHYCPE